jgi:hexosaminidase
MNTMKKALTILTAVLLLIAGCNQQNPPLILSLIPEPVMVEAGEGIFDFDKDTRIIISQEDEELNTMAGIFAERLAPALGTYLEVEQGRESGNAIYLELLPKEENELPEGGYELEVDKMNIIIKSGSPAGIFNGLQTLAQLMPAGIENREKALEAECEVPAVHIMDNPRFQWRGLLLDVSRHFFTKEEVLAYIDQIVKYKFNVLHLHLSDDQGWRVEIKRYPRLTEVGAWRVPRQGVWWTFDPPREGEEATQGGYYTQDDIREIVKYASDRQVKILPEIDIPGHSLALIASYPQLSNTGLQYPVNPGSRFYTIEDNTLDPSNEEVYEYLDGIFTEIAELFPFEYIHIGGDEAYKGFWSKNPDCLALMKREGLTDMNELQSYFIKRVEKILQSKGKKMIGWDEILEGGLAPDATVMSWRGMSGGIKAAEMGHKVVMSPTQHCYLDLYQGDPVIEPATYSMLRLRDVYKFEPIPEGVDPELVLGGQGNLWTESVATLRHAQYMTWPRAMALAEVLWSPAEKKDWNSFTARMEDHFERFDQAGVKYARSAFDQIITISKEDDGNYVEIETEIEGLDIYYSFDESYPDEYYPKYEGRMKFPKGASSIRAVTYRDGRQVGREIHREL